MNKKILISEKQLEYLVRFIKNNSIEEQLIKPKISGQGAFYRSKEKIGSKEFNDIITIKDVNDSLLWLKNNLSNEIKTEFDRKLYSGKKLWEQWVKTTYYALNNNIYLTQENINEQYNAIYYVKMSIESYLNAKTSSDKKIKKISIQPISEKTIELPKEKMNEIIKINFTKNLINQKNVRPFEDNMSEPTQFLVENVNEIVGNLQNILEEALKKDPNLKKYYEENPERFKWECTDLAVATSASRYANTRQPNNINFITLSKERAENGFNKIKEIFEISGVIIGSQFNENTNIPNTIKFDGENGDGTSGPPPPKGNSVPDLSFEGKIGSSPKYINSKSPEYEKLYNENVKTYGKPLIDKDSYNQFKYFWFSCNFILNVENPKMPLPPEVKKIKTYKIVFFRTYFKWNLSFDFSVGLRLPKINFGTVNRTKVNACPRFSKTKIGGKIISF